MRGWLRTPQTHTLRAPGDCPSQLAASFLQNLVIAVSRVLNRRPRADRGGRCRSDLLHDGPSDHEIEAARKNLRERLRKQKLARQTLAARQDPVVRGTLAAAYDRLKIDDPDGHILTATARYPLDAVVEGVAIFEGRRRVGSLSSTAGGRYLLGIVRNLAEEKEGQEIALALWEARVAAGDLLTRRLARHHAALASAKPKDPIGLLKDLVDQALAAPSQIERFFWLSAAADVLLPLPPSQRRHAFRVATRRIHATHSVPHRERLGATRFLAAKVLPLR